jgi:cobalamin biosynthesis protein CobT
LLIQSDQPRIDRKNLDKEVNKQEFYRTFDEGSRQEEVQYEAQIDRLRHSKFAGLREDKNPKSVVKENRDQA